MSGNGKKNITATILEKVARNSVKAAADMAVFFWKSFVITVCFINVNEFKEIGK